MTTPAEPSVNDIADTELLRRVVFHRGWRGRKRPRWAIVADRFSLGSTYAAQLCRRFGADPEEMIKP